MVRRRGAPTRSAQRILDTEQVLLKVTEWGCVSSGLSALKVMYGGGERRNLMTEWRGAKDRMLESDEKDCRVERGCSDDEMGEPCDGWYVKQLSAPVDRKTVVSQTGRLENLLTEHTIRKIGPYAVCSPDLASLSRLRQRPHRPFPLCFL